MRAHFVNRLDKLEEAVITKPDRRKEEHRREQQRDAQKYLAEHSDLTLVVEADATPLAWRGICLQRAQAQGDFATAERLRKEHYLAPELPAGAIYACQLRHQGLGP